MTLNENCPRVFVQVGIENFMSGGTLTVDRHDGGPVRRYTAEEGGTGGLARSGNFIVLGAGFGPAARYFNLLLTDLPSGADISMTSAPAGAAGSVTRAAIRLDTVRPEVADRTLLDGLAQPYYQTPSAAPSEITLKNFLPPTALRGKVRIPMPPNTDYVENVATYEYRITTDEALRLGILAGQADDPAKIAAASLIKNRDRSAIVMAAQAR